MRAVQSNGLARDPSGSGVVQRGLVMVTTMVTFTSGDISPITP